MYIVYYFWRIVVWLVDGALSIWGTTMCMEAAGAFVEIIKTGSKKARFGIRVLKWMLEKRV